MIKFFSQKIQKYKIYIKYVIAGGTAATVNLTLLFILTDLIGIYYIISATLAFIAAFFVSFSLQKLWTFRDKSRDQIGKQMSIYLVVGVTGLGINAVGMYTLVEKVGLYYILAQIVMGMIIAVGNFLIYRFIIFKKQHIHEG